MTVISEFDFISQVFHRSNTAQPTKNNIHLGMGDDCALVSPSGGMALAISTDMLLEGRHFLSTTSAEKIGHKALAVNLSDLAAMGAKPLAFTLGLAIPYPDVSWGQSFATGLFKIADLFQCPLVGGDTTAGPLCISITVMGEVKEDQALRRSGAKEDDDIYISHTLLDGIGAPRLAYETLCGRATLKGEDFHIAMQAMELPTPRVYLGMALQGIASSAIDVSDGLLGDLNHILKASQMGARIEVDSIPRSAALHHQPLEIQRLCTLSGGDDYELLFTAPKANRAKIRTAAHQNQVGVTMIGHIEKKAGTRLFDARGQHVFQQPASFDHFKK